LTVECLHKVNTKALAPADHIREATTYDTAIDALQSGQVQVVGGTAWLWARENAADSVDVLFVDEAGQLSLADTLAVAQAGKSMVLLGDPQQLEQPIQGTHPPGTDVAALQHILGSHQTMPADAGLFLSETWRLCPEICDFTSEMFYEGRLAPRSGLNLQKITGPTSFAGAGLWIAPVIHEGNQNSSEEEVDKVVEIVEQLTAPGVHWTDMHGNTHPLRLNDVLIVSPYNAQVYKLIQRLPGARIGTVDKFQGQEAPVVIYSMATSSPEDAPRGMEFLYSANRFNVATSRARCACILVANPRLFEPDCRTPRQMKLANLFSRYLELAKNVDSAQPCPTLASC
jgi:superfamily I DNA and/or RNA helicase